MYRKFSLHYRTGLTLIEAVLGIAILGTLMASVMVAGGKLNSQARLSEKRLIACRLADELLEGFWANGELDHNGSGDIEGQPGFCWRTTSRTERLTNGFDVELVRLDIPNENFPDEPAVSVEVIVQVIPNEPSD